MLDRKSTRLNSSHTEIYTLSLHDALPISARPCSSWEGLSIWKCTEQLLLASMSLCPAWAQAHARSEEHTSELQSHRDLHSFPTRRSSDLGTALLQLGRLVDLEMYGTASARKHELVSSLGASSC